MGVPTRAYRKLPVPPSWTSTGEPLPFDQENGRYRDPRSGIWRATDSPDVADRASAVQRLWQVLVGAAGEPIVFGVMRREAL